MKSQKLISLAIAMLFSILSFGQEKIITGVVTDGVAPLAAVRILVKNTKKETQTNFDGKYSILAKKGDQLVFSYIGMETKIVRVGNSNTINIVLHSQSATLDEIVVVGYAAKEQKATTASISKMHSPNANYIGSNTRALQGTVAGISISPSNNYANTTIRGIASISNNEPLYILDGVPVGKEVIDQLDSKTINNVTVKKGSTATAIYGAKASGGVIIMITNNGVQQTLSKKEFDEKLALLNVRQKQPIIVDQEDYESFIENQFETPKTAPLSTFSIDVDNASYTNIRRFINNGQTVPKDAVRIEEMMNFFKYNYPQPKDSNPFSINTEYSDCPWNAKHQLLKIGLQGKIIPTEDLPASNMVFLIDVSGSMGQSNKLPLLKQSMKILVNELRKDDKVAIVVYAGAAGLVLPPTSGDDKATIINALENLNAGGSTAGGAGIELAYKIAHENFIKDGNNRVILATDGDFNVGSAANTDMQTLIEEKRKTGVFLTCLGYGMGNYKDSKMEILANKGNGNYAYIDNMQEANRFLSKEFKGSMFAIAKDVKFQIEFNPKHVQSYRLIGYENRKLRPEDFKNDAIDAGELGSGHTVTALYEIIPTGVESDFSQPELKYTAVKNDTSAYSDELATIKFRYKKPDGDKSIELVQVIANKSTANSKASDDLKFSAAVAWFGLKLRDSKLISNKSSKDIIKLAKQGLSNDPEGYKAEFIRLVEAVK